MLFNSYEFLFLFLPVTFFAFFYVGSLGHVQLAIGVLVAASLFFYGWWNPAYLVLILVSIFFNYSIGIALGNNEKNNVINKYILILGISSNLILLAYFKYVNFFVDNINLFVNNRFDIKEIVLPLAISFFTFQQIAYLVDAYKGKTREYSFLHYCLFVTFFPQLIAGPIVHHKEMLPQFEKDITYRFNLENVSVGLTIFVIGLFKKVVLADGVSVYATPIFQSAEEGSIVQFFEGWMGAIAYTLQLYFDFSGYSDMAIGLARLFGIVLPLNFNSPYKAHNIIDFWRRWHMTLSRFLRDYLYISLGGSRQGKVRRYVNLSVTMVLGGLWHGAGWTFVFWGMLHGFYLIINHVWREFIKKTGSGTSNREPDNLYHYFSWLLTIIAIIVGWVFFRAESFSGALAILRGMFGFNGISLPGKMQEFFPSQVHWLNFDHWLGISGSIYGIVWIISLLPIVLFGPNTQQIMQSYRPCLEMQKRSTYDTHYAVQWAPTLIWSSYIGILLGIAIANLASPSEFLYFQF